MAWCHTLRSPGLAETETQMPMFWTPMPGVRRGSSRRTVDEAANHPVTVSAVSTARPLDGTVPGRAVGVGTGAGFNAARVRRCTGRCPTGPSDLRQVTQASSSTCKPRR